MEILDMGGGLAIDYDGSHSNVSSSCNYSLSEYTTNLIEVVQKHCRRGWGGASYPRDRVWACRECLLLGVGVQYSRYHTI